MAHVVDGVGSVGGEGGHVVAGALVWEHEAEECGERLGFLEDEGVARVGDQGGFFVHGFAGLEEVQTQTGLGALHAGTVVEGFGMGKWGTVTGSEVDGLRSRFNVLGKRKRPVAVTIPGVDAVAGADPVVQEHTALAVYVFDARIAILAVDLRDVEREAFVSCVELALKTSVRILVVALDDPIWDHSTVAVDV